MDRDALVLRNRTMTEAFHAMPLKHHLRRWLLKSITVLPIPHQRPPDRERILLVRPDHVGDVLLATPALHALRVARPHAEIHMLVGPWSASVLETNDDVDTVLTLDFPGFNRSGNASLSSPYQLAWRTARYLRRIRYHSAVILRPDHWWGAMVTYLAGIPERIGYDLPDVGNFLTHALPHQRTHVVMENLRLLERWTGALTPDEVSLTFNVHETDQAYIQAYLQEWGVNDQPYFCIHPGSGTWVKRWDAANWAQVADILSEQLDAVPIFTGGDHEMTLVQDIVARMTHTPCIMVGDTNIGQLAALFQNAKVVIGPDSGPLHLAAAVQTPTVALFGPADPAEFAQWGPAHQHYILTSDIGCRPCRVLDWGADHPDYHPCVREISVGRVLDAARRAVNPG
ncbi:MAG: glycosyltransferase family 9 protein [Phototrophicales bacterium]|nr:MAG: glycosyltransferase family 9 protein [Phototrophicales bacterium]RMG73318.1 MAG: glycosyltransferase family 9 protein [Chloroflexota bacterium]